MPSLGYEWLMLSNARCVSVQIPGGCSGTTDKKYQAEIMAGTMCVICSRALELTAYMWYLHRGVISIQDVLRECCGDRLCIDLHPDAQCTTGATVSY